MNNPVLFQAAKEPLRQCNRKIIGEYLCMIKLRPDGKDSLIDVGCGPGDFLIDHIRPILPKTYSKIVGVDISPKMVEHARRQYRHYDRVHFDVLDMGTKQLPPEYREKFDHVTSMHLLHWIQNQRQALQNMYDLLVPGGDCMVTLFGWYLTFDGYEHLAQNPRWEKYMFDLKEVIPMSQKHGDLWTLYKNLFKEVGFVDENIEVRERALVFHGLAETIDHFTSVNAFIERVPLEERTEYIKELCKFYEEMGYVENENYKIPQKLVVVYARKPNSSS